MNIFFKIETTYPNLIIQKEFLEREIKYTEHEISDNKVEQRYYRLKQNLLVCERRLKLVENALSKFTVIKK